MSSRYMTDKEFTLTDGATCPYCKGRYTGELEPPKDFMGDVVWEQECYDCGRTYKIRFKIAGYFSDSARQLRKKHAAKA